jgi:hypothetical protein
MRKALREVTLRRATTVVDSATTMSLPHPHVVVISTSVPDAPLTVTTTFVGADDVATSIIDLRLGVRPTAKNSVDLVARETLPVTHAREQCLLDHASRLLEALNAENAEPLDGRCL